MHTILSTLNRRRLTSLLALLVLLLAPFARVQPVIAQTALNFTTLSAAITDPASQIVVVASTTGITAPGTGSNLTMLAVDGELMRVQTVNTTTGVVTVVRGVPGGAPASTHQSGSFVYVGPPRVFTTVDQYGSCTATNQSYLPLLNVRNGNIWNCINSQWQAWNPLPIMETKPRVSVAGTAYTVLPTDYLVVLTTVIGSQTGAKSFTLPSHVGLAGKHLLVKDESGGLTATSHIVLVGTIDGTSSLLATVIDLKTPFGYWMGYAGSGGWFTLSCGNGGGAITSACR